MIESRIKNELSLKRYRKLKANRLSMIGLWGLILMLFFSVTAEFWANSKPIMVNYNKKIYFPFDGYCMYSRAPCGNINENLNIKILNNYLFMFIDS